MLDHVIRSGEQLNVICISYVFQYQPLGVTSTICKGTVHTSCNYIEFILVLINLFILSRMGVNSNSCTTLSLKGYHKEIITYTQYYKYRNYIQPLVFFEKYDHSLLYYIQSRSLSC